VDRDAQGYAYSLAGEHAGRAMNLESTARRLEAEAASCREQAAEERKREQWATQMAEALLILSAEADDDA
jgi:hypothetical protein